jgi:peptidyl-dipeptidase Dcp
VTRFRPLVLAVAVALAGCSSQESNPNMTDTQPGATADATQAVHANPLLAASTLAFQAPPFDQIRDEHFKPAIEQGMREHLAEIEAITANTEAPTFANTIEALERGGQTLTRAFSVFMALVGADTNDTRQAINSEVSPKLASHLDEVFLNKTLFARVKAIYDQRDALGLTPEQLRLVEHYQRRFERAGALLDDASQTRLREINQRESTLSTEFSQRLLAASNAGGVLVDDVAQLDGLDDGEIAAAADAAKAAGHEGKWLLPLLNTTQQPVLVSLKNRELRARVLAASEQRASRGDGNDTRAIVRELAALRAERAKLLGFPNFAAYGLADQMAGSPEAAIKLLTDTVPAATAKARAEAAAIQALIDQQGGNFQMAASDWDFYAQQVRQAQFQIDDNQVKPYFELDRVLKDGVFFAATELFGITFKERHDLPVYHPDVRVFDVFDADGTQVALFYADFFARPSKSGGAWMGNFVEQNGLTGAIPVVYNVCNYTKPADGQPALLSFDDVITTFHEFGHALHGFFSATQYPSLAGTNVPRDFVEFPSQIFEQWATHPTVLANYARHHQTGEVLPEALLKNLLDSRSFNQGYATTEYLAAALIDQAWHALPADAADIEDVEAFEAQALKQYNIDLAQVPPRYRTPYFAHIWGGGYSAGYYAYFQAEVLARDAFAWFTENGGLSRKAGEAFRQGILSRGHTADLTELYRAFRGGDAKVDALLEYRGLDD